MSDGEQPDWGKLNVDAMNAATTSPEFTKRYKAWLERIGPKHWTPVAKADFERMLAEEQQAGDQQSGGAGPDCN